MLRVRVQLGDEYRRFYITRGLATRKNLESKARWLFDLEDDEPYVVEVQSHNTRRQQSILSERAAGGTQGSEGQQELPDDQDHICLKLAPYQNISNRVEPAKTSTQQTFQAENVQQRLLQEKAQQQQLMMDVLCDLTHFVCTRNGEGVRSWMSEQKKLLSENSTDVPCVDSVDAATDISPTLFDQLSEP